MQQRVKIVSAELCQLSRIAEIARMSFPDPWTQTLFQQTLQGNNGTIWCAVDGTVTVGYLVLSWAGDAVSVDDIAVHPEYRRQGIARQLLEQAHVNHAKSDFLLEVRESNKAAIALYQSMGYEQVGLRKRYYTCPNEGAVLMTRNALKIRKERGRE